ncbi:MAG: CHC2 zinc finger domain-containing protein [Chloroflexota bacterium]|nr:CHC2 zinc finger domain-containing protein [Chloroflexota bacterium]
MPLTREESERIEKIKNGHELGAYIESRGIELNPDGGRVRQGLCPFHNEQDGSFTVYRDTQRFYCFGAGCNARGDIIEFIQRLDKVSFGDALSILERTPPGKGRSAAHFIKKPIPRAEKLASMNVDMPLVCAAMEYYRRVLLEKPEGQPGRDYFKSRGISRATADSLFLGYSSGTGLIEHLQECDFEMPRILRTGLLVGKDRRERFANMVVIPEVRRGQSVWATGRLTFNPQDDAAGQFKGRFNAMPGNKAILGIGALPRRVETLYVAEGVFDWLTLKEWGLNAIGLGGNGNVSRLVAQINKLRAQRVIIAMDADAEGRSLAQKLLGLDDETPLKEQLNRASMVSLPKGFEDIGDMAHDPGGKGLFLSAVAHSAESGLRQSA